MRDWIYSQYDKFGGYVIVAVVASLLFRLKNKMTKMEFLGYVITAGSVGLLTGVLLEYFLGWPSEVTHAISGVAAYMSEIIIEEIKELIQSVSYVFRARLGGGSGFEDKSDPENMGEL